MVVLVRPTDLALQISLFLGFYSIILLLIISFQNICSQTFRYQDILLLAILPATTLKLKKIISQVLKYLSQLHNLFFHYYFCDQYSCLIFYYLLIATTVFKVCFSNKPDVAAKYPRSKKMTHTNFKHFFTNWLGTYYQSKGRN